MDGVGIYQFIKMNQKYLQKNPAVSEFVIMQYRANITDTSTSYICELLIFEIKKLKQFALLTLLN